MKKLFKGPGVLLVLLLLVIIVTTMMNTGNKPEDLKYFELIAKIKAGEVQTLQTEENIVIGIYKGSENSEVFPQKFDFHSYIPNEEIFVQDLRALTADLSDGEKTPDQIHTEDFNFEWESKQPSDAFMWLNIMFPFLMLVIFIAIFWFGFMKQNQGQGNKMMSFGKSRAKLHDTSKKKVTFKDVAGAEEEKKELEEVVDFLKNPKKYIDLGARIPKGVLLVGAPGTGKTLFARAVAGESGVPFFSISGSDFVEMFVGVGASRVRDLFNEAKKNSPCIVFVDEIDAVGRHRGAGLGGSHDEREQTLNQLLVEMDGFSHNEGIIMIAATNRPDILDPALLRPGRFDRQIVVGMPDVVGREAIIAVHARNKKLSKDISIEVLAKRTVGFTGADIENMLNEAAILTARSNKDEITMIELEEAISRVVVGTEKKSKKKTENDNRLTAYHEAGHAMLAKLLPNADPVHEVSIIPRGMAGGYTMQLPTEDKSYVCKKSLIDNIMISLGGRIAEDLVLDDISSGAGQDIKVATNIARRMVTEFGMSSKLGPVRYSSSNDEIFLGRDFGTQRTYSESVASEIDAEIKAIIDECYEKAEQLIKDNIDKLHNLASELLKWEKLTGEEFSKIFDGEKIEKSYYAMPDVDDVEDMVRKAEDEIKEPNEEETIEENNNEPVKENDEKVDF